MGAAHYERINPYTFDVEHSYSVVQTYDPSPAWNQNLLLQEQKPSGVEKKKQCYSVVKKPIKSILHLCRNFEHTKTADCLLPLEENLFSSSSLYKFIMIKP